MERTKIPILRNVNKGNSNLCFLDCESGTAAELPRSTSHINVYSRSFHSPPPTPPSIHSPTSLTWCARDSLRHRKVCNVHLHLYDAQSSPASLQGQGQLTRRGRLKGTTFHDVTPQTAVVDWWENSAIWSNPEEKNITVFLCHFCTERNQE